MFVKVLWAPWRMEYILSDKESGCFLCDLVEAEPSGDNLLLFRSGQTMVLMNRYPYNNGHLMVAPLVHTSHLSELETSVYYATMELFRFTITVLEEVMTPEGFNAGLNLGRSAGAGLEDHIHWHVVPRWAGDTNFMPVISDTRVIPEGIMETYRKLKPMFDEYSEN